MCECCLANTVDVGQVAPGWKLVRATTDGMVMKAGQYGLRNYNDPSYYLSEPPVPAPDDDPEAEAAGTDGWAAFFSAEERLLPCLESDPWTGYALVSACMQVGYSTEGPLPLFTQWLLDRLGRMIAGLPGRIAIPEDDPPPEARP